jgi:hypothetical protein
MRRSDNSVRNLFTIFFGHIQCFVAEREENCRERQILSTAMDRRVAVKAQHNQIHFLILACVAAKLFVVDLKVGHGTAQLASPAISPQYLLSKILVILLLEPDRRLFRQNVLHWICPFTICRNACR